MTIDNLLNLGFKVSKYCVGMEGNVSCVHNNGYLIKASGTRLDSFSPRYDDILYREFGHKIKENSEKRPSLEYKMHEYLLGYYNYVAHTHPENVVSIMCSGTKHRYNFRDFRLFPDQVVFNKKESLLIDYYTPGEELAKNLKIKFEQFIETNGYKPNTILLGNHGLITCGGTVNQCLTATEICEKSAKIYINSCLLGHTSVLSEKSVDEILSLDSEKYRANK